MATPTTPATPTTSSLPLTAPRHKSVTNPHLSTSLRLFPHPLHHHHLRLHHRHTTTTTRYKISITHDGETTHLDVEPDETILEKALESGMTVPHDCKLGVCMTCPAKLLSGNVDQSEGMLSDDVIERGYSLLCVSYPKSDCEIEIIPEEELLSLQLATADD